jgi:AraC-like DNA-binding protein
MNTFNFKFNLADLITYSEDLAKEFGHRVENGYLAYPEQIAHGGSKFIVLNEYITAQIANYTSKTQINFEREAAENGNLTISFQDFTFEACTKHNCSCGEIIANNKSLGSVQIKSTAVKEVMLIEPGLKINVLLLHFKKNWENYVFNNPETKEKLSQYVDANAANVRKEFMTVEQNALFKKIMEGKQDSGSELLFYQAKVFALLDSFFSEILSDTDNKEDGIFASSKDVEMIQMAEKYILDNLSKPFVGVDELARLACMSRTKFINLFQKIYKISSFDYYQKHRLSFAYSLILEGNKSLHEVAENIGYANVQNFNNAFEKEFGLSPKIMLKQQKN